MWLKMDDCCTVRDDLVAALKQIVEKVEEQYKTKGTLQCCATRNFRKDRPDMAENLENCYMTNLFCYKLL